MKKLTKTSAVVLFVLFLTACDKPTNSNAENDAEQTIKIEVKQPETEKTEEVKSVDIGAEDYKTLRDWQNMQEKALNDAITNATDNLTEKQKADPTLMQETVNKALLAQIDRIKANAKTLNIQHLEVKALKNKIIEVLELGAQMIVEGAKMEQNPTPEAHKAFAELQGKLNKLAEEGQQLENSLNTKYAPTSQ